MIFDWDRFLVRLRVYPSHFHRILPACSDERIEVVEKELGEIPMSTKAMLRRFNGAKLFLSNGPSFNFFGITLVPALSPLEWAPEWHIDTYTREWRKSNSNRQSDWVIGITNYGGLILVDGNENVKEWDTGKGLWLSKDLPIGEWIEKIISEGDVIMEETC